jgi:FixJ family two-component response regulator
VIQYTKVYWIPAALLPFSYVATLKLISIVDDDESVREGLSRLLISAGFAVNTFASAEKFLSSEQLARTDCLLLDMRMPGKSGLELERQLVADHSEIPVIFITAHEEETARGQTLEGHARTVLIKPFSDEALLNAINNALAFALGRPQKFKQKDAQ